MGGAARVVLGTAGHIDHGKSALVRALTGTDPDRLKEEKRRGITIELGFAELALADGSTLGIVDVPGHERFVRQMISGSTGIDIALLCIAADDGVMPQTDEHLAILELLDVETCVVAITKADLVDDEWLAFMTGEIAQRLAGTRYADAPLVATSSRTGQGLDELKRALEAAVEMQRCKSRGRRLRLPVDRVFSIKGSGTVVTGTLWSGTVACEDEAVLLPGGHKVRVRGIQVYDTPCEQGFAGSRVALNLGGVSVAQVRPGDMVVAPGSLRVTDRFDARMAYVDTAGSGKPLVSGRRVRIAHGTREVFGRVLLMDGAESLAVGVSALVQVRLEEPLAVAWKDHFVVRSYSPVAVVGGGMVLDAHPRRRTTLAEEDRGLLAALEGFAGFGEGPVVRAAVMCEKGVFRADGLCVDDAMEPEVVEAELERMVAEGLVVRLGDAQRAAWYCLAGRLKKSLAELENLVVAFHADNRELPGIQKGVLLQRFAGGGGGAGGGARVSEAAFEALLFELEARGVLVEERGVVCHSKAAGRVKAAAAQAQEELRAALAAAAGTPPTIKELLEAARLDPTVGSGALAGLEGKGLIVRVSRDYYFGAEALAGLQDAVVGFLQARGSGTAAELKDAMGVSRKYAIPLLEHFDARHVTARQGDLRVLG